MSPSVDGARRPQKTFRPKTQEEKIGLRPEYFLQRNRVRSTALIREAFSPGD